MTRLFALLLCGSAAAANPWAAYRGTAARTGNTDGVAGPATPTVAWVIRSNDHFVASPVPVGENLHVAGLGAFNRPVIGLYSLADGKPVWTRSAPYLRLASVSSPAVGNGLLVFGDGMHQDAGGTLHALAADSGRPAWHLPLAGELIHLEGGPSIVGGKVFMAGGSAGVFAVDLTTATHDGKDLGVDAIAKLQAAKWQDLQAAFEAAKKKDPDFAVPPTEDGLLKPAAKVLWKAGEKRWHVDAPLAVASGKVLVCTSYLEQEKTGLRAVVCLNAVDGKPLWEKELKFNPWGGASILGDVAVITGSSVGYYYQQIKQAKGDVTAFDLKTGEMKWRKDLPCGVVGCAALSGDVAVVTATDGKVRAFDLATGERRWLYDAKAAFFAPPAVAGGIVYAAELNGVLHAISLAAGNAVWKLDLANDPAVKSPGSVYGGPIVHGGAVYVATCNLDGPNAQKPTCVVKVAGK